MAVLQKEELRVENGGHEEAKEEKATHAQVLVILYVQKPEENLLVNKENKNV